METVGEDMSQGSNGKMMNVFLVSVLVLLLGESLVAIPWAMDVHGRLTAIETLLMTQQGHQREFESLSDRVLILETKMVEVQ